VLAGVLCPDGTKDARSTLPGYERLAARRMVPLRVARGRAEAEEAMAIPAERL